MAKQLLEGSFSPEELQERAIAKQNFSLGIEDNKDFAHAPLSERISEKDTDFAKEN